MTPSQDARLQHLLAVEFPTPLEDAELDGLLLLAEEEANVDRWVREQRQELWAEAGGYAAGLPRPTN